MTVDIEDVSARVERVQSLLEDDAHREQLAERITLYNRANSFDQIGADHRRIYHHVVDGTTDALDTRVSETVSPRTP